MMPKCLTRIDKIRPETEPEWGVIITSLSLVSKSLTGRSLLCGTQELAARDSMLADMVRQNGVPPMWCSPPGYASLVKIILGQQVSLASAAAVYARLSSTLGRVTPSAVLGKTPSQLGAIGLTRQKSRYCRELALAIRERRLDLVGLRKADEDTVRSELTKIAGIGAWTADIYLLMSLLRPDIWPRGDLALYLQLDQSAGRKRRPEQWDAHARRWKPWRSVAARILWHHYLKRKRSV